MISTLSYFDNVSNIKGIGEKKRDRLSVIGIETVFDLLNHFPYRYKDMRIVHNVKDVIEGEDVLVKGTLISVQNRNISGYRIVTECLFKDEANKFNVIFFNMPYIKNTLKTSHSYKIFGKMKIRYGVYTWTNPEIFESGSDKDKSCIVPVYHCTAGLNNNDFIKWISYALDLGSLQNDWIDENILEARSICDRSYAYRNIHFPLDLKHYQQAKFRIVYEQLLIYQLSLRLNKKNIEENEADSAIVDVDVNPFIKSLPFTLTDDQKKCIEEIEKDLINKKRMNRLIQGDVGSGKTVIAEAAIYKCVKAYQQAAMMAPTELLATQHYLTISKDLEKHGIHTCLLTSGLKKSERDKILSDIRTGKVDVVVGTHAIIQDDVSFKNLSLVITDEQHRFGVNQRKFLSEKGNAVNVCVMSATPIPRTLAATVFGDMDFSIIKSKPSNRLDIITKSVDLNSRERAYNAAEIELKNGHQVYVVAPSIDNQDDDLQSAEQLYDEMKKRFSNYKVALIHGKQEKTLKEKTMQDFADGKFNVLVATVVIEVGIDVPNASLIIIENAERFGLAQMHQLRGRVGRSDIQSYCYLVNYSNADFAKERIKSLVEISDGFEISEVDFAMRGPGDISGTMQSGNYSSNIISLCKYTEILDIAIKDAEIIMNNPDKTDFSFIEKYIYSNCSNDNSNII